MATFDELQSLITDLQRRLDQEIRDRQFDIKDHQHDGLLSSRVNFDDILGGLQTITAVPTDTPRDLFDYIRVYKSGSSYRLYIYDVANNVWKFANIVAPLTGVKTYYVSDTSGGAVTRKLTFTDGILTAET